MFGCFASSAYPESAIPQHLSESLHDLQVIYDRETGRSRGFAFVTFATQAEANAAIEQLDGTVRNFSIP